MCALVYGLLTKLNLTRSNRSLVHLFNNGDDCVLIGERADILRVEVEVASHFALAGFVMKVEPIVDVLEKVSFCQTQPVYDGVGWRMVRDIRVSLSKDATLLSRRYAEQPLLTNQLYAVGECGMALTGGIPVLQEYYKAMRRGGVQGHVDERFLDSGFYRLSKGLSGKERVVEDATRVSFCRAFGIVPDLQVELERYYAGIDMTTLGPVQDQECPRVVIE